MAVRTYPFDASEFLNEPEAIAEFITSALESGDSAVVLDALGVVARARGMTQIANGAGVSRQSLYRALREEGNAELSTVLKVLGALGVTLEARPIERSMETA